MIPRPIGLLCLAGFLSLTGVTSAQRSTPPPAAQAAASAALEHLTVPVDGLPMAVWARVPANPRGAVLLLHGRTWSSIPDFDLQVPGLHRSVLASLAEKGYAAYALDQRGYGATPRDATGYNTPKRAAADAIAVLDWIAKRHPTLPKPALLGWSLGAATSHLAAWISPASMSAVILYGFAPNPDAEFAKGPDAPKEAPRDKNTRDSAAGDFVSPAVTPRAVVTAFMDAAIKADPIHAEWKDEDTFICDSSKIVVPTLLMYGEHDSGVDPEEAGKYFAKIGSADKQLVVFAGADHVIQLEDTHDAFIAAIVNFLSRPGLSRR
jgi:pimeloyl-ACP methyl ester carboxylesterase